MRIFFLQPNHVTLAVECLSAHLKSLGHQVEGYLDPRLFADQTLNFDFLARWIDPEDEILDAIKKFSPDLICFSVIYDYFLWAIGKAGLIKKHFDIPIVFGGVHATTLPERVLENQCIDYVVMGEGEGPLTDLCNALENGRPTEGILNLAYRVNGNIVKNELRPLIQNLDSLPHPDKYIMPIWQQQHWGGYSTMASRGCPFQCSYCCHSYLRKLYKGRGKYVRHRSVENFMDELYQARRQFNPKQFVFHDESFPVVKRWFTEFAQVYSKEMGLPYFCWVSPDSIDDDRITLLKESGCRTVQIGVQGAPGTDDQGLANRQQFSGKMDRALSLLRRADIFTVADNVVGLPGQNSDDMKSLIRYFSDNPVDLVFAYWLRYYPKTAVVDRAVEAGMLTAEEVDRIEGGKNPLSFTKPQPDSDKNARRLTNLIMIGIHLPKKLVHWLLASDKNLRFVPAFSLYNLSFLMPSIKTLFSNRKKRIQLLHTPISLGVFYIRGILKRLAK